MSDRYEALRKALGDLHGSGRWDSRETRVYFGDGGFDLRNAPHPTERAAYIAAANPDTIRELLRERDALRQSLWDVYAALGCDTDGDPTPAAVVGDLGARVLDAAEAAAKEYREACDEAYAARAERDALLGLLGEARDDLTANIHSTEMLMTNPPMNALAYRVRDKITAGLARIDQALKGDGK